MRVETIRIPDVKLVTPKKFGDHRGFFSETYNRRTLASLAIDLDFVQDNHSFSAEKGVVRGLHYQVPPFGQDKLVRVVRGAIFDVAVDLRRSSPTFGQHIAAEISAERWNQILVPVGFAHGSVTLEPNTEVVYKVTNYWSAEHERVLAWNDPELNIGWPVDPEDAVLSDKDRCALRLADIPPQDLFD